VPRRAHYELDTIGRNDFYGTLPGGFTAHPKVDPDTGEMHAMVYAWAQWMDHVQYVVVGTDGRVRRTVDIPLPACRCCTTCRSRERYAVVYDQPVTVDFDLAFAGRFPFRWTPDYGNRLGLLPREGSADDIVWIDAPICYSFHPLNAYDTPDGSVVVDLCVYDRMFDTDILGPFGDNLPRLERWVLNPAARTMSTTVIDDTPNEFPRHRGALTAKPYRYGYCAAPSGTGARPAGRPSSTICTPASAASSTTVPAGRPASRCSSDAPAPIRSPPRTTGGCHVRPRPRRRHRRVRRDRRPGLRPRLRGAVPLPQRVPFGFHGNWVSDRAVPPPA
jgi:8'-apo-carotenoid 13,14-cleaving dioxygenase